MGAGLLSITVHDGVGLVTLQRPEKRNALSIELRAELADALSGLGHDDGVACAVLTGAGSTFCAGMDVTQFGGDRANRERLVESSISAFDAASQFPKPLIGAINGPAIAGGFVLALHCDVRIVSDAASFGFTELRLGIPPSYAAALAALPEPLARELCLTGRLLDAAEALRWGVAAEVVPFEATVPRAVELARAIAQRPPATLTEIKRRFLLGAAAARGALQADEERVFREAVLRDEPEPAA